MAEIDVWQYAEIAPRLLEGNTRWTRVEVQSSGEWNEMICLRTAGDDQDVVLEATEVADLVRLLKGWLGSRFS